MLFAETSIDLLIDNVVVCSLHLVTKIDTKSVTIWSTLYL